MPPVPRKSRLDYEHLWNLSVAAQGSFGGYFVAIHIPKWDKTYKASWVTTGGPPATPATSTTTIATSHRRTLSSIGPTSSSSPAAFNLPGLTQSEIDWALAFFIHPRAPPISGDSSPEFRSMARRLYEYFYNDPLAEASWKVADATAASLDALVAPKKDNSSSNDNKSGSSNIRRRIDSNVGVSSNVGRIQEEQEESSSSDSSPCKPVKKPRVSVRPQQRRANRKWSRPRRLQSRRR